MNSYLVVLKHIYVKFKRCNFKNVNHFLVIRLQWSFELLHIQVKFPPDIYYKIFTHRHIEDLCANSPRNYTKLPAKYTSHIKSDDLQEENHSGWYRRVENNGWRPVTDTVRKEKY